MGGFSEGGVHRGDEVGLGSGGSGPCRGDDGRGRRGLLEREVGARRREGLRGAGVRRGREKALRAGRRGNGAALATFDDAGSGGRGGGKHLGTRGHE